jgi:ribosome-associated protein
LNSQQESPDADLYPPGARRLGTLQSSGLAAACLLADPGRPMNEHSSNNFELRGELITLDALLKATGLVSSGGNAKALIAAGSVGVNGQAETRRGRKLRAGDVVLLGDQRIKVVPAVAAVPRDDSDQAPSA